MTESLSQASPKKFARSPLVLTALTLAALWFVLCRHLSSEWLVNEQYSYGWFVPFFAAFLFWLRWESKPEVGGQRSEIGGRSGIAIAIIALLLLFPVRLFEVANPDWRPLGWVHALAVTSMTFVVIYRSGGWSWVKHFSFPILFFLVAVPWVSPIEQPIVQGLMRLIASLAAETITLFGIPAQVEGNLIRIANGVVGVNEACSGVRSLQTSIMIGLLFGELKRLPVGRRVVLLAAAIALALMANLLRAIFLVWIASSREISAVERWHDAAGYAIVAVVFCGSLTLTALLARQRSEVRGQKSEAGSQNSAPSSILDPPRRVGEAFTRFSSDLRPPSSVLRSPFPFLLSLAWLVAVEVGVEAWYRAHEKELTVVGSWSVRPPEKAPGFREIKIEESVRQTLRFDEGREVTWKSGPAGESTTNYLFFFRWNPGSASVLRARAHRPDICLPSVGWSLVADRGTKNYSAADDMSIAVRHVAFKQAQGNIIAHTFFCLQEDKINRRETRPDLLLAQGVQPEWSMQARMRMVRAGIRNQGQQVLEFIVVAPRETSPEEAEARFAAMLPGLLMKVESRK